MYWVNGIPASSIALTDRSFNYGDGCFTTMLTRNGTPQHWPYHIERMKACLELLGINQPDWQQVEAWLKIAALNELNAGLKLHISRGEGGRGYSPIGSSQPFVTINHFSLPENYQNWREKGAKLGIAQHQLGIMPLLAGHKHNNRLEQVLIKAELEKRGHLDGIVLDLDGNVIETSMANLFWVKSGVLYTPTLARCGVAGVQRRVVLEISRVFGFDVRIGQYKQEELLAADEVFITNSLLCVAPVIQIGTIDFPIGPITRKLQESVIS